MKLILISGACIIVFAGLIFLSMGNKHDTLPQSDQAIQKTLDVSKEEQDQIAKETSVGSAVSSTSKIADATVATALFANGCFWCVEHDMAPVPGVLTVVSGYAGGSGANPTYANYADTGFREVVEVTYNPQIVSYANLVEHIIKHGDPTDASGSFHDRGLQYAPAIYFKTAAEKLSAETVITKVNIAQVFAQPLPLVVIPRVTFYLAEEYHQDYAKKNLLKYSYYRTGSGRTKFITDTWGKELDTFTLSSTIKVSSTTVTSKSNSPTTMTIYNEHSWDSYVKPSDTKLQSILTSLQYKVTQKAGTESPYSNQYEKNYEAGIYVDIVSGEPLYSSRDKFDSGTGWPSFVQPLSPAVVTLQDDSSLFSKRTQVLSAHAGSHLGHVFTDGPQDRGGMRYCMNSASLRFIAKDTMEAEGYGYLLSKA